MCRGSRGPEIFNTDQGMQFTSEAFIELLEADALAISIDGRGRVFDNIFSERPWRTVKYEEVYLHDYADPEEARQALRAYFRFYNEQRPHQALDYRTPAQVYYGQTGDDKGCAPERAVAPHLRGRPTGSFRSSNRRSVSLSYSGPSLALTIGSTSAELPIDGTAHTENWLRGKKTEAVTFSQATSGTKAPDAAIHGLLLAPRAVMFSWAVFRTSSTTANGVVDSAKAYLANPSGYLPG